MPMQLSHTHKEIINLIQDIKSTKELEEIKSLLNKGYTEAIFEKWKNEHFRKSA